MGEVNVRLADELDAAELLAIYEPYVRKTAVTFEYEVPQVEEFRERIRHTKERYPYLVAVKDGQIVGYAYVSPFKTRAAYDWAVETSIYVKEDAKRDGIGRFLYQELEKCFVEMGILNANACIACTDQESEQLTNDSIYFHEKMGYQMVGKFHSCGYKFGRWFDMVWMEKCLGDHVRDQKMVVNFSETDIYKRYQKC